MIIMLHLPQAFLNASNTFKPVSYIGAMNNTSSTVLNFSTWFTLTASVHVPKPKLYLQKFFTIIFPHIVPKPKQCWASQLVLLSLESDYIGTKFYY